MCRSSPHLLKNWMQHGQCATGGSAQRPEDLVPLLTLRTVPSDTVRDPGRANWFLVPIWGFVESVSLQGN